MAFHNVPPNGFPDIPDIEDLEAVQGDITALKTGKAPKTDIAANFSSTANYAVGDLVYKDGVLYECINAHEAAAWAAGDFTAASVGSAISGVNSNLSGYEATTNAALALPENTGKNIFPLSFDKLKKANALVSWVDNTYTRRGVTATVTTNESGYVTNINLSGTVSEGDDYLLPLADANSPNPMNIGRYILSGCPSTGGGTDTYRLRIGGVGSDNGNGLTFNVSTAGNKNPEIVVKTGYELPTGGVNFKPMIRPANITDATFAPYIPSVETRLEAVEQSELTLSLFDDRNTLLDSCIVKAGKIVTFTAKVTMGTDVSSGVYLLVNMPKAKTTLANNTGIVSVSCSRNVHLCVGNNSNNSAGVFTLDTLTEGETYIVSGTYISA